MEQRINLMQIQEAGIATARERVKKAKADLEKAQARQTGTLGAEHHLALSEQLLAGLEQVREALLQLTGLAIKVAATNAGRIADVERNRRHAERLLKEIAP